MRRETALVAALFAAACNPAASPNPVPVPDSNYCPQMCQVIGPADAGGLGCAEGEPLYDSTLPGPANVPNESCTQFCTRQQSLGVFVNPKCVMQVTAYARNRSCPREELRLNMPLSRTVSSPLTVDLSTPRRGA